MIPTTIFVFILNVKNPSTTCGSLGGAEKPGDDFCCSEAKAQLNRNGEGPTHQEKKRKKRKESRRPPTKGNDE